MSPATTRPSSVTDPAGGARRPRPTPQLTGPVPAATPDALLRQMVGVALNASVEEFRTAYDLAMHRATRSGDHRHALTLSRAYDRLPAATRQRLYPSTRSAAGRTAPTRPSGRVRSNSGHPARSRRTRQGHGFWLRVLVYGLFVPLTVGIGTYVGAHRHAQDLGVVHSRQGPVPVAGWSTVPVASTVTGPASVPADAPIGADGLASLMCQTGPGSAGYLVKAPRGAVVACGNGAAPTVVR